MSKNVKLAINGGIAVALLAGLIWFAMEMKDEGATCRYCGKVFPHEHIFGHQSRCCFLVFGDQRANQQQGT